MLTGVLAIEGIWLAASIFLHLNQAFLDGLLGQVGQR